MAGMLASGNVSRTNLISGPYGSGKTSAARLLSLYVNCEDPSRKLSDPPCEKCHGCRDILLGAGRDYLEINAANYRGIDAIRSITDAAQYKPSGRYRIFVLDEVHQLTPEAWQAFLKILEEPPPSTIFILCTTDPQKMPVTALSRCKRINITPVKPEKCRDILRRVVRSEKLDSDLFTEDLLFKIAVAVNGHPRDALMTLEAIMNKVQGKGNVEDIDQFVLTIVDKIVGISPDKIAAEFLLGAYRGKATDSIAALQDILPETVRHPDLLNKILDYHTHTMYWRFSPKLQDSLMGIWYEKLTDQFKESKPSPETLVQVLDLFNDVLAKIKRYEGVNYYTLISMAVKASLAFKVVKKSEIAPVVAVEKPS
jgi:DNA polymerase-3 subunit gamma/tau